MSDIMTPISFTKIMDWAIDEYKCYSTIFGVSKLYKHTNEKMLTIFNEKIETPFGPAAGPHTQLAQNLIASYVGGSRFFELKTVQVLECEELNIAKPCIVAKDEAYNTEWSTELRIKDAFEEYAKAWFAIKLLSKEYGFGDPDGFIFNMSVGYDLDGIKSEKIDTFIESLKNAKNTEIWAECTSWAKENISKFKNIDEDFIDTINPKICTSITLSTLHGCPPEEIEKIVNYLIKEKKLHTYIKCNPTLLGYEFTRKTMDDMGYGYLTFDDHHFKADLQYEDAIPMIERLIELGKENNLEFGVKLTNTFPVKIMNNELAGEEMYMSGRSLYPLTINVAKKLETTFRGKLPVSFSGGADLQNIDKIYETGIWPITIATILLKQGGYNRLQPMAEKLSAMEYKEFTEVDVAKLSKLAEDSITDKNYIKGDIKPAPSPKENKCTLCVKMCNNCIDVCPNRANYAIKSSDFEKDQLVHFDKMCNECGNCIIFCPYQNVPYKEKFTVFATEEDFKDSTNEGFVLVDKSESKVLLRLNNEEKVLSLKEDEIPTNVKAVICTIIDKYEYSL